MKKLVRGTLTGIAAFAALMLLTVGAVQATGVQDPTKMTTEQILAEMDSLVAAHGEIEEMQLANDANTASYILPWKVTLQTRWSQLLHEKRSREPKREGIDLEKLAKNVFSYEVVLVNKEALKKNPTRGWDITFIHPKTGQLTTEIVASAEKPATAEKNGHTVAYLNFLAPNATWVADSKMIPSKPQLDKSPKDMTAEEINALMGRTTVTSLS